MLLVFVELEGRFEFIGVYSRGWLIVWFKRKRIKTVGVIVGYEF